MTTISEVLEALHVDLDGEWGQQLLTLLTAREDNMADLIRLAGAQFGLYPQAVSKVLMDVGLGTAPTPEARALIDGQFVALMEQLQEEHRRRQNPEQDN